ncbi:MAG: hypothetical protein E6Q40_01620 [Cupriavidus sp.]|nr:MAG: hypothetical protein E6Q40_01620 [Cupriavidus sp.]
MIARIIIRHLCFAAALLLAIMAYESFGFRGLVIEAPYCVLMIGFGIAIGLQAPSIVRALAILSTLTVVALGWLGFKQTTAYANATGFSITADPYRCVMQISGTIPPDLPEQLETKLKRFPQTRAIVLNSSGGSSYGVIKTADLLRKHPVTTAISSGQCDSACAFLWVTQKQRVLLNDPLVITPGFHAPYTLSPWGVMPYLEQRNAQIRYLKDTVKAPDTFIARAEAFMGGVDRMRPAELRKLGITTSLMKRSEMTGRSFCEPLGSNAHSTSKG